MDTKSISVNSDLLNAVTKGLGPSIYKKDAETVKKNFLIKKLGLSDSPQLDEAIAEVIEKIGKSERNKYRAVVYYMLAEKFNKQSIYGF